MGRLLPQAFSVLTPLPEVLWHFIFFHCTSNPPLSSRYPVVFFEKITLHISFFARVRLFSPFRHRRPSMDPVSSWNNGPRAVTVPPPSTCHLTQTGLACTALLPQTLERAGNHLRGLQRVGGSVGLGGGGRRWGGGAAEMEQENWNVSAAPHLCRSTSLCYITFSMAPCHRRNGPGSSPLNESETGKKNQTFAKVTCWQMNGLLFISGFSDLRIWKCEHDAYDIITVHQGGMTAAPKHSALWGKKHENFFPWQIQLISKFLRSLSGKVRGKTLSGLIMFLASICSV